MNTYSIIILTIAITTFVLALADRLIGLGNKESKVLSSIKLQEVQIEELRKSIASHDATLTEIRTRCATRIAQTSTTEEMRKIFKEEIEQIPGLVISELYNKGILRRG